MPKRGDSLLRRSIVEALAPGEVAGTADCVLFINRHSPGVVNGFAVATAARLLRGSSWHRQSLPRRKDILTQKVRIRRWYQRRFVVLGRFWTPSAPPTVSPSVVFSLVDYKRLTWAAGKVALALGIRCCDWKLRSRANTRIRDRYAPTVHARSSPNDGQSRVDSGPSRSGHPSGNPRFFEGNQQLVCAWASLYSVVLAFCGSRTRSAMIA